MQSWFNSLHSREQRMLMLGVSALVVFFLYELVWQPVQHNVISLEQQVLAQQQQYAELAGIIKKYTALPAVQSSDLEDASLLSIVDASSRKHGIRNAVKRLTPEGEGKVRVRLENVVSDKAFTWLASISRKYVLQVDQIDINPESGAGMVTVCVVLKR